MKKLFEHIDPNTGEVFHSPAENHYEVVDSVPFAPPVDTPRLTLRERIERMLYSPQDPNTFISDGTSETDFEDDGDEPLTPSEQSYLKQNATLERFEEARIHNATLPPAGPLTTPAATPPAAPPADGPPAAPSPVRPQ